MAYKHGVYAELTDSKVKYNGHGRKGQTNNSSPTGQPSSPNTQAKLGAAKLGTMKLG